MRSIRLFFALVLALGFSAAAQATPVQVGPVAIGDELSDKSEEYGARDIDRLTETLTERVTERLERDGHTAVSGAGAITVSLTLEDAWPNRPTREQMRDEPGLSFRSISLGGASVSATIRDADGAILGEVSYRYRTRHISDSVGRGTWSDAHRTFDRFARQLSEEIPGGAS